MNLQQTLARSSSPKRSAFPLSCDSGSPCKRSPPRGRGSLRNCAHQGSAQAQFWALASHNAPGSVVPASEGDSCGCCGGASRVCRTRARLPSGGSPWGRARLGGGARVRGRCLSPASGLQLRLGSRPPQPRRPFHLAL